MGSDLLLCRFGLIFLVLGSGFWVLGSGFWVLGSGFWEIDMQSPLNPLNLLDKGSGI